MLATSRPFGKSYVFNSMLGWGFNYSIFYFALGIKITDLGFILNVKALIHESKSKAIRLCVNVSGYVNP